jgi:activating signal cointegrator 1
VKALTLTQPWASLVAVGAKVIETRSWSTSYRGPLAIHAAKGFPLQARRLCIPGPGLGRPSLFCDALRGGGISGPMQRTRFRVTTGDLPLGAVVATCELVACRKLAGYTDAGPVFDDESWIDEYLAATDLIRRASRHHSWEQESAFGDYSPGRYAWFLDNIRQLDEPTPAKGALGLWEWDRIDDATGQGRR